MSRLKPTGRPKGNARQRRKYVRFQKRKAKKLAALEAMKSDDASVAREA